LSLSLTGLGLLTLPLLIGMGNAMLKLEQLTNESQAAVSTSAASTLENQRIARSLANMERNARLFLLLQTPEQLELFDTAAVSMTMSLDALERLPHTPQIAASIQSVRLAASELATQVHNQNSNSGDAVIAELQRMTQAAGQIADGMRLLVSERLSALEDSTRQSQETLLWQAAALIPGTLILVLFFLLLIGRPLRQVDRAIRELGSGDFSHEISVTGPADIETLGRQLEWLRNRLQESTEEKNKCLRHMSHELKTPLANIREGTELLLDGSVGELDRQQKEVTGILRDNSLKLQRLIENLLTFSAWQTKTEAIELTEFELKPLVFAVLSLHRLNISNRKIKLDIDVSAIWISADEGKLRLVLENLVSNATKFTPDRGTIFVRAGMQAQQLVLDVADSGPGVAVEDRARIFEAAGPRAAASRDPAAARARGKPGPPGHRGSRDPPARAR
jgi:two-component system sensor histidine kinase GlrK